MEDDEPESSGNERDSYVVGISIPSSALTDGDMVRMIGFTSEVLYSRGDALRLCEEYRIRGHEEVTLTHCNGYERSYMGKDLTELIREAKVGLRGKGRIAS